MKKSPYCASRQTSLTGGVGCKIQKTFILCLIQPAQEVASVGVGGGGGVVGCACVVCSRVSVW